MFNFFIFLCFFNLDLPMIIMIGKYNLVQLKRNTASGHLVNYFFNEK